MAKEHASTADTLVKPESPPIAESKNHSRPSNDVPREFLADLLTIQCRCTQAQQAAALRPENDDSFTILAIHSQTMGGENTDWLQDGADAARTALSTNTPLAIPRPGSDRTHIVLLPLELQTSPALLEAFLVETANRTALESITQLLQLTAGLVSLTCRHLPQDRSEDGLRKLRQAMETLAAANHHNRFKSVAMSLCNELAAQWRCERVSVGFLKGRCIRIDTISHTEHFNRKMRLVQDIEAAMEECFDQDAEVVFPASEHQTCVYRTAQEFSAQHSQEALLSLPLRHEGQPHAVVTLERPADRPFTPEEVETIRLTCDLCTPRLMNLQRYDRWFGARATAALKRGLAVLLGAQHTWAKLATVLVCGLLVVALLGNGWYRVKAPFILEAVSQHKVTAPFDSYIKDVFVEVGDQVIADQTRLAELDTAELRLQLAATRAEQAGYLKQADAAMRDGNIAEAQIAQASADKAQAMIDLDTFRIEQADILAPLTGTLVTGDMKRQIGAPVETGKLLFEIAPLDSLRAELHVPEDEVSQVEVGQQGHLATASFPSQRLQFIVERVNPAAEVVNNRNVFKVRVRLLETRPWLRPGMEGVAKITIEKRRYAWIWTRKVVDWIRMKLWI
jgi:multidrug efflux pump subunit AcrA (membrane-fusion protein)